MKSPSLVLCVPHTRLAELAPMYLQLVSPKDGLCAPCHSGTPAVSCLLFLQLPTDLLQYGTRLQLLHVQVVGQFSGVILENKIRPLPSLRVYCPWVYRWDIMVLHKYVTVM